MRISTLYAIQSEANSRRRRETHILQEMQEAKRSSQAQHTAINKQAEDNCDNESVNDDQLLHLRELDTMIDTLIDQQKERVKRCLPISISSRSLQSFSSCDQSLVSIEDDHVFVPRPGEDVEAEISTVKSQISLGERSSQSLCEDLGIFFEKDRYRTLSRQRKTEGAKTA